MAQQDTIDKIINIQFKYSELVQGWVAASDAIDDAKTKLQEFKKRGMPQALPNRRRLSKPCAQKWPHIPEKCRPISKRKLSKKEASNNSEAASPS